MPKRSRRRSGARSVHRMTRGQRGGRLAEGDDTGRFAKGERVLPGESVFRDPAAFSCPCASVTPEKRARLDSSGSSARVSWNTHAFTRLDPEIEPALSAEHPGSVSGAMLRVFRHPSLATALSRLSVASAGTDSGRPLRLRDSHF